MLILGGRHLRKILSGYVRRYNRDRPHQGLQQNPPLNWAGNVIDLTARIERRNVVGGLINEYHRAA